MGVGRQLGKGDGHQLVHLERAFNDASDDALRELRRELLSGTPVIHAVASTVLPPGKLRDQWNRVGSNWFGPSGTNQWLEPCTPPEKIQQRVADAWVTMVEAALEHKRARIELWCKCGHPNFEAFITYRRLNGNGLVIVTLLVPDMNFGYEDSAPTQAWTNDDADPGKDDGDGTTAWSIGAQPYATGDGRRAMTPYAGR